MLELAPKTFVNMIMKTIINKNTLATFLLFTSFLAIFIVPELNNAHFDPLPQFWAEISVAWAVIILFIFTIFFIDDITVPFIAIPIILFALYLLIQTLMLHIDFSGLSYTITLELFICLLAVISLNTLQNKYNQVTITILISSGFLVGSILQSLVGFLQYSNLYHHFPLIAFYDSVHPTTNIFGNMGQRNHYADYMSIGVFGLIYLFSKKKIHYSLFSIISAWFIFSLTIAGSRSVLIYFIAAIIFSAIFFILEHRNRSKAKAFVFIVLFTLVLISFQCIFPHLEHYFIHHKQISSGVERIASDYSNGGLIGRRMVEWHKAFIVFKHYPLLGYGLNEYAKQSIILQPLFPHAPLNDGLFTNCHNLFLQLLAETGIIGSIIVISGILYFLLIIFKKRSLEDLIILCMFSSIFIHSQVEYPLWYMYFLVPFVMFLATTKPLFKISGNLTIIIFSLPLIAMVYLMVSSSIIFNTLVYYNDAPDEFSDFKTQGKYLENLANNNILWSYPAYYSLDNYINVDDNNTDKTFSIKTQLAIENKFTGFHPYPDNIIKQAKLNWILGNKDLAKEQVKLALVSYPVYKNGFIKSLTDKHGFYDPLLKIAKAYSYK